MGSVCVRLRHFLLTRRPNDAQAHGHRHGRRPDDRTCPRRAPRPACRSCHSGAADDHAGSRAAASRYVVRDPAPYLRRRTGRGAPPPLRHAGTALRGDPGRNDGSASGRRQRRASGNSPCATALVEFPGYPCALAVGAAGARRPSRCPHAKRTWCRPGAGGKDLVAGPAPPAPPTNRDRGAALASSPNRGGCNTEPLGGARPRERAGVPDGVPEGRARGGAAARRVKRDLSAIGSRRNRPAAADCPFYLCPRKSRIVTWTMRSRAAVVRTPTWRWINCSLAVNSFPGRA